jgi:hypothetical protein
VSQPRPWKEGLEFPVQKDPIVVLSFVCGGYDSDCETHESGEGSLSAVEPEARARSATAS